MSNMQDIIREIYRPQYESHLEDGERWASTKSGWNAMSTKMSAEAAKKIYDAVNSALDLAPMEPRENTQFTVVKRKNGTKEPWRKEEALERLIVAANTGISNQVPVSNAQKENADLLIERDGNLSIAELKYDTGTPVYALVELAKNVRLLGQPLQSMIFVAPKFYFQSFSTEESIKAFFEITQALKQEYFLPISILVIDLAKGALQTSVAKYVDDPSAAVVWKESTQTTQYTHSAIVDARAIIQRDESLKKILCWDDFQRVTDFKTWPKK